MRLSLIVLIAGLSLIGCTTTYRTVIQNFDVEQAAMDKNVAIVADVLKTNGYTVIVADSARGIIKTDPKDIPVNGIQKLVDADRALHLQPQTTTQNETISVQLEKGRYVLVPRIVVTVNRFDLLGASVEKTVIYPASSSDEGLYVNSIVRQLSEKLGITGTVVWTEKTVSQEQEK